MGLNRNQSSTLDHREHQHQTRVRNFHIVATGNEPRNTKPPCSLCSSFDHGVWFCKLFYDKGVDDCWQIAKERKLSFHCLASNHRGKIVQRPTYVESMVALDIITTFLMDCQKQDQ